MPFPLTDGADSPVLADLIAGPAAALTAVALVAAPAARASGWAPRAAAALAARWHGPRRIVLADLGLEAPSLHEVTGTPNDEGVADLIDYGLSMARLVRAAPGADFDVLAAGIFVPEPGATLRSAGWERVLLDVAARRATLLAYVPSDADGVDAVVMRAGAVLVLAEPEESDAVVEALPHPYAVLAVLTPAPAVAEAGALPVVDAEAGPEARAHEEPEPELTVAQEPGEPALGERVMPEDVAPAMDVAGDDAGPITDPGTAAPAEPEVSVSEARPERSGRLSDEEFERIRLPKEGGSREALIAELRDRQRAARMGGDLAPAPSRVPAEEPALAAHVVPTGAAREGRAERRADAVVDTISPPRPSAARPGRYRHALLWTLGVVLLASLLAGAWHLLGGRLSRAPAVAETPEPVPEPPAPPPPQDALPYVVAIEAHRDIAVALDRVVDLAEIEPELAFHVEPLEREGVLYYHVMGGPVPDSLAAEALRDTLVARGHKTGRTPGDIRTTPLAYFIGDYATAEDAAQQLDVLRRLDIPGYVLPASAADGEPVFRLYVGGFGGEAEAGAVGQLLRAAGIRDTLVERTGSIGFRALLVAPDSMSRDSTAMSSTQ